MIRDTFMAHKIIIQDTLIAHKILIYDTNELPTRKISFLYIIKIYFVNFNYVIKHKHYV